LEAKDLKKEFASILKPQTLSICYGMLDMKTTQMIPLQQIDLSDETFSVNYLPDLRRLRSSIEQIGMTQPVLLRRRSGGYQIICGFRRISVMKELEKSEIESRVFEEKEIEEFHLFSLSLQENLTTRGFNVVEKAIALEKLIRLFIRDQ
jgi:ParB family chromosome partitioning protein